MKAMAVVAHPDDCVIFAMGYMLNHAEYSWTVCYLTYTESHKRGQEFTKFWSRRGVAVKFLGYPDQWNLVENCPGHIDDEPAISDIQSVIANQDLVLTHAEDGDYGHPHHILVNRATQQHPHRVTFAAPGTGTVKYTVPADAYSLDELPLHRDVIAGFHSNKHVNEYK
jgi:LmbE family N-acetylglucosaminyl deacetylase